MEELPDRDLNFRTSAVAAATSSRLARSFDLDRGDVAALDIDFYARDRALAWLVGVDDQDEWWESTVWLGRSTGGEWASEQAGCSSCGGWASVARDRPESEWPFWGPILALGFGQGSGAFRSRHWSRHHARGIAAAQVTAIEFGPRRHTRRRGVDSPTGAFVIAVDAPPSDWVPVLRATVREGQVIDVLPGR
jgi:hypothetical protein